ncbi:MAG: serine/threonine-protein kinase [Pseudomonadota bacterium]|nr:serine/threonine-protein kinase [Pseudomonadota bacterium]
MNDPLGADQDSSPAPSDPGDGPGQTGRAAVEPDAPRYERQGLIGRGGMGRVYAARDARLRRQVALKVAATPELADRLAREAWITAQLEHPGIVAVYDAGETEGQAWYTMRLIRGRTLRERLAACPDLGARIELLPHLHAACQAVAYAHSMGIVHRDLKPSNIMVGEFGETQVADWGLATPLDEALPDWKRIVSPAGDVSGTPRYMSPEQARGAPASRASDVFGLGAALYELLAGHAPPGEPGVPPDADALPGQVPRELVAIARRCLRADPAARYPTAGELAADLGRWLSGQRVHAHEYRPTELLARLVRAWRIPLTVGGIALLALAAVVVVAVERTARERAAAEGNLAVALTRQALAALLEERLPEAHVLAAHALRFGPSPEARGILAATRRNTAELVWRVPLPPGCRHGGVLAPDAETLACRADGKLEIWGIDPLVRRAVLDLSVVEDPVWVGERLLVATPDALLWIEEGVVVGTTPGAGWWPLASGEVAFATRGPAGRRLLPDGEGVDFEMCWANRSTTRVVAGELVVGCDDGFLRSYGPDGALRLELPLGERPAWSAVREAAGGLLVGRLDGDVQALALPEGRWTPPLRGLSRSVLALQPIPGTPGVLVLGERGGPRIWNTEAAGWAGSLPAGASRMFPGTRAGEVLLLGDTLQLWRVSATPRPTVLSYGTGASQVTPSPDGESLAVALGAGEIVERRLADGHELRRWTWGDGVAKCVAYAEDGLLVAAAMGAPGQVLGPSEEIRPLELGAVLRRAGRLADGTVWAFAYTDAAFLVAPRTRRVTTQATGPGLFDGSSSPDGGTAALLDTRGGVWLLEGTTWREARRMADAVAVDVGEGGAPLVVARRREVCIEERCYAVDDDIIDVAFSGDRVAVATLRGDVSLLDAGTGERLALLRGHAARVSSVEFGPGGEWLVSGSWDGTARLWDLGGLDEPAEALITRSERAWGLGLDEAMRSR